MTDSVEALITLPDRLFEVGGAWEFADDIAVGFERRCDEAIKAANRGSVGVMFSTVEVLWLVEAYARLRRRATDNSQLED